MQAIAFKAKVGNASAVRSVLTTAGRYRETA
jgi:hypothetical protein